MNFAELRFWGYLLTGLLVLVGLRFLLRPLLRGREQVFDKLGLLTLGLVLLLVVRFWFKAVQARKRRATQNPVSAS